VKKHRRGAYTYTEFELCDGAQALGEMIRAATPRGRIAKWRGHAKRLGVGIDNIDAAEAMIDTNGHVPPGSWDRFDLLMKRAVSDIEMAQVEESIIPKAQQGINYSGEQSARAKKPRKKGIAERNDKIKKDWHQTSAKRAGITMNAFAKLREKKYKLNAETIRKIISSPSS